MSRLPVPLALAAALAAASTAHARYEPELLAELNPAPGAGLHAGSLVASSSHVWFVAEPPRLGLELNRMDFTARNVTTVEVVPGPRGSLARQLTPMGDGVLFMATAEDGAFVVAYADATTPVARRLLTLPANADCQLRGEVGGFGTFACSDSGSVEPRWWSTDGNTVTLLHQGDLRRSSLALAGGRAWMVSYTNPNVCEVRASDGTVAGTQVYTVASCATAAGEGTAVATPGGRYYWVGPRILFASTSEPARLLPEPADFHARQIARVGEGAVFSNWRSDNVGEVWRVDGSEPAPVRLLERGTGLSTQPRPDELTSDGVRAVFVAQAPQPGAPPSEGTVWRTDGTLAGTRPLFTPDWDVQQPRELHLAGGHVLFRANGLQGARSYFMDATLAVPTLRTPSLPLDPTSGFAAAGGRWFVQVDDDYPNEGPGLLRVDDGVATVPAPVAISGRGVSPYEDDARSSDYYASACADGCSASARLYRMQPRVRRVQSFSSPLGGEIQRFAVQGDRVLMVAAANVSSAETVYGTNLDFSVGEALTPQCWHADVAAADAGGLATCRQLPGPLALLRSDGRASGTATLASFAPASAESLFVNPGARGPRVLLHGVGTYPMYRYANGVVDQLAETGNGLLPCANDGPLPPPARDVLGATLVVATRSGNCGVHRIGDTGALSSVAPIVAQDGRTLTVYSALAPLDAGRVAFAASDATLAPVELWASDGTAEGTTRLASIARDASYFVGSISLVRGNGGYYVAVYSPTTARGWFIDEDGGAIVALALPDGVSWFSLSVADANGSAYGSARDANGEEPWRARADGRVEPLGDLFPGGTPSGPRHFRIVDGYLVFFAQHPEAGVEPWRMAIDGLHRDGMEDPWSGRLD